MHIFHYVRIYFKFRQYFLFIIYYVIYFWQKYVHKIICIFATFLFVDMHYIIVHLILLNRLNFSLLMYRYMPTLCSPVFIIPIIFIITCNKSISMYEWKWKKTFFLKIFFRKLLFLYKYNLNIRTRKIYVQKCYFHLEIPVYLIGHISS